MVCRRSAQSSRQTVTALVADQSAMSFMDGLRMNDGP